MLAGKYQPIESSPQGWLWSQQLELYLGIFQRNLRFYTPEAPEETAQQETQRAEQHKQRSHRLAAKLQEFGIDPNTI